MGRFFLARLPPPCTDIAHPGRAGTATTRTTSPTKTTTTL